MQPSPIYHCDLHKFFKGRISIVSSAAITVLVTVYNREQYVAESIRSILSSRFTDFELVIVDDASVDSSFEVAQQAVGGDSRARLFRNDRNLGQFQNRNAAASYATGKYIKFLDSDDILYPYSLSIMHDAMESRPTASHAICHSVRDDSQPYPQLLTPLEAYSRQFLGRGCMSAGPSSSIIRRDRFLEVGGYRTCGVASDIDLWFRMSALWDTVLMQPSLVWWRRHEGQAFSDFTAEIDYIRGDFSISSDAIASNDCPFGAEDRLRAASRLRRNTARRLLRLAIKQRKPLTAWKLLGCMNLTAKDVLSGFLGYL